MWRLLEPGDIIESFDESYITDDGGLPKWKCTVHHLVGEKYENGLVPMRRQIVVDNSTQQPKARQ